MTEGFEILHNFLNKFEHQKYLDTCNRVYNTALKYPNNEHYCWYDENHLNKIQAACNFEYEFLELASHPTLISKAQEILDTDEDLDIYISKFFPMMPNGGVSTFMHQDNYYFRGNPNEMVSCAVYLEDTYKENGCLRIAKNSHLEGIVPHNSPSEHDPGILWIGDDVLSRYEIVDLELPAPYAVFFNIDSIHGCYQNLSNSTRFSLAWEYIARSNDRIPIYDHIAYDRTCMIQQPDLSNLI